MSRLAAVLVTLCLCSCSQAGEWVVTDYASAPAPVRVDSPVVTVKHLAVVYRQQNCAPCDKFDRELLPKIVAAGFKVSHDPEDKSADLIVVDIQTPEAKRWQKGLDLAFKNGTPYVAHYRGTSWRKGYAGIPELDRILSDMRSELKLEVSIAASNAVTSNPVSTSVASAAWNDIPETWPARVAISGTRTPSRETLLWHLRGGGSGGENHRNQPYHEWPLEQLTVGQLATLHDRDHGYTTVQTSYRTTYESRPQYRSTPVIYRRTYSNCPNGICPVR